MTEKYIATLLDTNTIVEEMAILLINKSTVPCFLSYCPRKIEIGKSYEIELEIVIPDADYAEVSESQRKGIEPISDGLSCFIYGYLNGSTLQSFVDFHDQEIHFDYPSLNQKYVKILATRINASFD